MERSKLKSLIKRVVSACILAPVVLGALFAGYYPGGRFDAVYVLLSQFYQTWL